MLHIPFDNTYARELPGFYVGWKPATVPAPALLFLNRELAHKLGSLKPWLDENQVRTVL